MANKQDSNLVGLSIAEESSLGVLPGTPDWFAYEPSSYNEFGNQIDKVARTTINATRKVRKGGTTDVSAQGGFEHDMVMEGLHRLFQGFFFTDGDEKGTTDPLDPSGALTASSVTASSDVITYSGSVSGFLDGSLVVNSGFNESTTNGLKEVTNVSGADLTFSGQISADETPPSTAKTRVCGFAFGSGEISTSVSGDTLLVANTGTSFITMGLKVGDTVFLGGDGAANALDTAGAGYGRITTLAATSMRLADFTGTVAADTGTGKSIYLFFGLGFRDEPTSTDITRRTYQLERTLGDDGNGDQSEYITGAVPNQLQINLPRADKMSCVFNFQGLDREVRDGTTGVKSGTRHAASAEEFVNTSTDVFVTRLRTGSTNLIGYIESLDISIDNGINPNKAVGVTGAFDFATGDFEVTGSVNAYFDSIDAMQALRDNDDVSLQVVVAKDNAGFALAMPLVTLGGGVAQVASDEPVMLPLELYAAADSTDVTLVYNYFAYLPTVAMPS